MTRIFPTDVLCGMCGDYHADALAVKLCHAVEYLSGEDDYTGALRRFLGERDWARLEDDRLDDRLDG